MEKPNVKATVVFLVDKQGRIGLAQKKQPIHHDVGAIPYSLGTYNGWGGKQEPTDATILDTAVRELLDESGVTGNKEDLDLILRAYFYVKDKKGGFVPFMDVSFYFLHHFTGIPTEGREMGPAVFFQKDKLPYHNMMPADEYLLGQVLKGERGVYEVRLLGKGVSPEIKLLDEVL